MNESELKKYCTTNYNVAENGEFLLYDTIKDNISVLFDVGAAKGYYFLQNKNTEYHLFEPNKEYCGSYLNILKNLNFKYILNNFGLGDKNERLHYYAKSNSVFLNEHHMKKYGETDPTYIIDIKRADDYIYQNKITNIDFMKIDVEGYEYQVLKGLGRYISLPKLIQFETALTPINPKNKNVNTQINVYKTEEVVNLLSENEYDFYLICANGLIKLDKYYNFLSPNILAVKPEYTHLIKKIIF
jgi:FkbM family methyltransferase